MSKYETAEYQRAVDNLVRREVHYCVSGLVSTIAEAYALPTTKNMANVRWMLDQAIDLVSPIDDYETPFIEQGYEIRHDIEGYYACTHEEGEYEDAGHPSVGFDGRQHGDTDDEVMRFTIDEPYQTEVFEHWIVSDWLADKLAAKGEKVDKDFAGLTVWARTCTGPAISLDRVICDIYDENCDPVSRSFAEGDGA